MSKVIPFPVQPLCPAIDWDELDAVRRSNYPRVAKRALEILRKGLDGKGQGQLACSFNFELDEVECYPPEQVHVRSRTADLIWVMDLLDRYGGTVSCGKLEHNIRRKTKRLPVFQMYPVSEFSLDTLMNGVGGEFEHALFGRKWKILGKDLPGTDLIGFFIEELEDMERRYFGILDRSTANIYFRRLDEGLSVEKLIEP